MPNPILLFFRCRSLEQCALDQQLIWSKPNAFENDWSLSFGIGHDMTLVDKRSVVVQFEGADTVEKTAVADIYDITGVIWHGIRPQNIAGS